MGIIKDISCLNPVTARKCRLFLKECEDNGLVVAITETVRLPTTHLLYYLQGRLDANNNKNIVEEYNAMRKQFGIWECTKDEALHKQITWTLDSNHADGYAFDCVPLKDGKTWWAAPDDIWNKMGEIAKDCGLAWGGYWPAPKTDKPHFEDI